METVQLRLKKATRNVYCVLCSKIILRGEWHRYRNTSQRSKRHTHIHCIPNSQTKMMVWTSGTSILFSVKKETVQEAEA